jgi:hypothetical protein
MSIRTEIDVYDLKLPDGIAKVQATSLSTGLEESVASGAVTYTSNNLIYTLSNDATHYIVTGVSPGFKTVSIPAYYNGRPVSAIYSAAFESSEIESVVISSKMRNIGAWAFSKCSKLRSITIEEPDHIIVYFRNTMQWATPKLWCGGSSGNSAYDMEFVGMDLSTPGSNIAVYRASVYCTDNYIYFTDESVSNGTAHIEVDKLINFACYEAHQESAGSYSVRECAYICAEVDADIDSRELKIGHHAFSECFVRLINIPRTVRLIPEAAFSECTNIYKVTFSNGSGVRRIGDYAFHADSDLRKASLPYSLEEIGLYAYAGCSMLGTASYHVNLKKIGNSAFANCTKLAVCGCEEETGSLLEKIGEDAFYGCTKMTGVGYATFRYAGDDGSSYDCMLPNTLWFIGKGAFEGTAFVNISTIGIEDSYGWLYTSGNVSDNRTSDAGVDAISPEFITDKNYVTTSLCGTQSTLHWFKIDKMPAPELSLSGQTLTITDNYGLASVFTILVDDKVWATVNASDGKITLRGQEEA